MGLARLSARLVGAAVGAEQSGGPPRGPERGCGAGRSTPVGAMLRMKRVQGKKRVDSASVSAEFVAQLEALHTTKIPTILVT